MRYTFETQLWRSSGAGGWFFVTLPADVAQSLRALSGPAGGFGSVRVRAEIGGVAWSTSVFPDSRSQSFLLPVKAEVRRKAGVTAGDHIVVQIALSI